MKKSLMLLMLALTTTCVVGCGSSEPGKDDTEITKIEIAGNLKVKNYKYNDEWNLSGLVVNAIQKDGTKIKLDSDEYKMTLGVAKPKDLTAALGITVKYNRKKTITATRSFTDIFVADEEFDEEQEIADYYDDCDTTLSGNDLIDELHRHSFSKHTYFVKYGETSPYLKKTKGFDSPDLIPGAHNTEFFYTGKKSNYEIGTREHVWPCNDSAELWVHDSSYESKGHYVDSPNYVGGGADLYHLRPCDSDINTARGDAAYVDFDETDSKYSPVISMSDGGSYKLKCYKRGTSKAPVEFADYVEVDDAFKGDIARTIAYLYMHYRTNSNTPSEYRSMTGNLQLTRVLGYSSTSRCIEILKKWNKLDKPSAVEKHRNHVVQQIQGNRNPFVDDYTLIDKMFK